MRGSDFLLRVNFRFFPSIFGVKKAKFHSLLYTSLGRSESSWKTLVLKEWEFKVQKAAYSFYYSSNFFSTQSTIKDQKKKSWLFRVFPVAKNFLPGFPEEFLALKKPLLIGQQHFHSEEMWFHFLFQYSISNVITKPM